MLLPTRQIVNAQDEWKYETLETLTILPRLYKDGRKVAALVQVADVAKQRQRKTAPEGKIEEKRLRLQTLPGLD